MPEINVKQIVNEWKKELKEKKKDCEELGINFELCNYKETIEPALIYEHIKQIKNPTILQLPVPKQIDLNIINKIIPPELDVDGFSPFSKFKPCTPSGIIHLLDKLNFDYNFHHAVIIGRSQIVGRPMGKLLLDKNMTISICHSKTAFVDLVDLCNKDKLDLVHLLDVVEDALAEQYIVL